MRNEGVQEFGECSRVHSCQYVLWSLLRVMRSIAPLKQSRRVQCQQALQYTIKHDDLFTSTKVKLKKLGSSFLSNNYDINLTRHDHGKLATKEAIS